MNTTPIDVTSPEAMESLRRSVALLSPDQWALRREVALRVLGALVDHLVTPKQLLVPDEPLEPTIDSARCRSNQRPRSWI